MKAIIRKLVNPELSPNVTHDYICIPVAKVLPGSYVAHEGEVVQVNQSTCVLFDEVIVGMRTQLELSYDDGAKVRIIFVDDHGFEMLQILEGDQKTAPLQHVVFMTAGAQLELAYEQVIKVLKTPFKLGLDPVIVGFQL